MVVLRPIYLLEEILWKTRSVSIFHILIICLTDLGSRSAFNLSILKGNSSPSKSPTKGIRFEYLKLCKNIELAWLRCSDETPTKSDAKKRKKDKKDKKDKDAIKEEESGSDSEEVEDPLTPDIEVNIDIVSYGY